jgi:putative DNA primase/helicase
MPRNATKPPRRAPATPDQRGDATIAVTVPEAEKSFLAGILEQVADDPEKARCSAKLVDAAWFTLPHAGEIIAGLVEALKLPGPKLADVTTAVRHAARDQAAGDIDPAIAMIADLLKTSATTRQAYAVGIARYATEIEAAYWQRQLLDGLGRTMATARARSLDDSDIDAIEAATASLRDAIARRGAPSRRLVLRPISEIESTPIDWLWPQRIVGGGLTIITGPVGNTKSLFTVDIAARVSTGCRWPDGTGHAPVGSVIMFGNEDDPGKIVRPRLEAAGADLSRVMVCEGTQTNRDDEDAVAMVLEQDIAQLRQSLESMPDCRLIVFDPLSDYLLADENSAAEVRAALMPLAKLAQEKNVAILAVAHQNKKNDLTAVQRIGGSGAFAQVARGVIAIGNDPDDPDTSYSRRRVMLVAKNNYGERDVGQAYRLIKRHGDQVGVEWIAGTVEMAADDLSRKPSGGREHEERRGDAVDALRDILGTNRKPAEDVKQHLEDAGFRRRQIDHAAKVLEVVKRRLATEDGGSAWHWWLPPPKTALQSDSAEPFAEVAAFSSDEVFAEYDRGRAS